jgi:hypothetical protein
MVVKCIHIYLIDCWGKIIQAVVDVSTKDSSKIFVHLTGEKKTASGRSGILPLILVYLFIVCFLILASQFLPAIYFGGNRSERTFEMFQENIGRCCWYLADS